MKITHRVDRRDRGLDNIVRMYEARDVARGNRTVSIQAGILNTARRMQGTKVLQGKSHKVLADLTNAAVASLQEYGTSRIPARPFIGPVFRQNRRKYSAMIAHAVRKAQQSKKAVPDDTWKRIGATIKKDIQDYILKGDGVPPPNAPATIAKKGHGHTLMDSVQMLRAVDYRVVK